MARQVNQSASNEKVYIHEFIDIIGHDRARYMHHMTANWSPIAQEERNQLCYGVWGVVGSTGPWPAVVNMWEEDGWEGLSASFGHELSHAELQDPKLARWWATAAEMRSGGFDRILVPAPWSPTITELCAQGAGGVAYAHDQVTVPPGSARRLPGAGPGGGRLLLRARSAGLSSVRGRPRCGHDDEAFLIWSIPELGAMGRSRGVPPSPDRPLGARQREAVTDFKRILLVDAPLGPLRTGRQPSRSDRDDSWSE